MHTQELVSNGQQVRSYKMKNTYEVKTNLFGQDYLEMTTPDGVVSFVPMVAGNADYEAYLNPEASNLIGGNNE
jgi:hypothetical protein